MKQGDYFVGNSLQQMLANAKGKYSSQFMNGELSEEDHSQKMDLEASTYMGGYDVNVGEATIGYYSALQQPMAKNSDYWLG